MGCGGSKNETVHSLQSNKAKANPIVAKQKSSDDKSVRQSTQQSYIHDKNYEFRKFNLETDGEIKIEVKFRDIRGIVEGKLDLTPAVSGQRLYEEVKVQTSEIIPRDFMLIFNGRVVQPNDQPIGVSGLSENATLTCIFAPLVAA